jgi:type II secretory ATPase GspE/PulE/Tfp pilus assembly ATPase PilB-like protein
MSTVFDAKPQTNQNLADISSKLEFQKQLQAVTNRIHATSNVDEIMLELGQDICSLVGADRLTIYVMSEDRSSIVSKVKTGLTSFKDLKLPINDQSIAGFVGQNRNMINIRDVYDENELRGLSPQLRFLKEVDKRTGYRTKQMLVAPVVEAGSNELIGVVQAINTKSGQPFSPLAEESIVNLCETLAIAFKQRQKPQATVRGKYDALVANANLSAEEMELALRSARRKGLDIEAVLLDEFRSSRKPSARRVGLLRRATRRIGWTASPWTCEPQAGLSESSLWAPVEDVKEGLIVVTTDPERVRASRIVSNIFPKHRVIYRVTTARAGSDAGPVLRRRAGGHWQYRRPAVGHDAGVGRREGVVSDDVSLAADNELVKLVNKVIIDAYNQGASDIHIEPYPGKGKTEIRFRRTAPDAVYLGAGQLPQRHRGALKIMCDLDISEKRKPQDGKIKFRSSVRSTSSCAWRHTSGGGVEDIVMRILAAGEPIPIDKLGLSARNVKTLKETVSKPYGLFFVCGPTGSGKTTTLHSVMGYLNTPDTKIWTAEDPVEITQKGLRQVQMNPKAGLNFAVAMRAFLRADPDIIMVGEMRDKETTAIGIEASLTGHLVFATLHTNSAPESIIRLLDMGMDPFNFSDALLGVLAQRLAKRLCSKCKQPHVASQDEIKLLLEEYCQELKNTDTWKRDAKAAYESIYREWAKGFADDKGQFTLYNPVGCESCSGTGYKGRVGLHELLVGSDAVKKLIQEHSRVAEILAVALNDGMRTLKQDGMEKVLQGVTDMHQVRAVCIK